MNYKVNKQKCTGCGACLQNCPGATKIGTDGKAEVINREKLEECGGESVCPFGAIEKIDGKPESEQPQSQSKGQAQPYPFPGQGRGMGKGRGMGAGRGRGLGAGPRDGRGMGRGGGRRR